MQSFAMQFASSKPFISIVHPEDFFHFELDGRVKGIEEAVTVVPEPRDGAGAVLSVPNFGVDVLR
jgi:hypothetical protein